MVSAEPYTTIRKRDRVVLIDTQHPKCSDGGAWYLLIGAHVGNNLLRVLLTQGRRSVEVQDSVVALTTVATTVVIVSTRGLLVIGLLVVVVTPEYLLILLAELGGLLL
jgi:hypothetical protein